MALRPWYTSFNSGIHPSTPVYILLTSVYILNPNSTSDRNVRAVSKLAWHYRYITFIVGPNPVSVLNHEVNPNSTSDRNVWALSKLAWHYRYITFIVGPNPVSVLKSLFCVTSHLGVCIGDSTSIGILSSVYILKEVDICLKVTVSVLKTIFTGQIRMFLCCSEACAVEQLTKFEIE